MKSCIRVSHIAPCGMNCGVCKAHLREKNKCPGCRKFCKKEPVTIFRCKIRTCKKRKGEFCYDCDTCPCEWLIHLDKRYRTKYDMSEIENLQFIRDNGIKKFLRKQSKKYSCAGGKGIISVHDKKCYIVKNERQNIIGTYSQ